MSQPSAPAFYIYNWNVDEEPTQSTIYIFGITEHNRTICIRVHDFQPSVYVELPDTIEWTRSMWCAMRDKLDSLLGQQQSLSCELVYKKRLYYANTDAKGAVRTFPYLHMKFASIKAARKLQYVANRSLSVQGTTVPKCSFHELSATSILQLMCEQDIPSCGWVRALDVHECNERQTTCADEFTCSFRNLRRVTDQVYASVSVKPVVCSFDIECNSTIQSAMPNAEHPLDVVFQISMCFQTPDSEKTQVLLSLGALDPLENTTVVTFASEKELLMGFIKHIKKYNPHVVIGYNIFQFDLPYMLRRAERLGVQGEFMRLGMMRIKEDKLVRVNWASKAYSTQDFQYIDMYGRLMVDMLPVIQRNYKFASYKLGTVADHFLGTTKDPLSPKDIFDCYLIGMKGGDLGRRALSIVGKYCVKDSDITLRIMEHTMTWIALAEMAATCVVPIIYLYTKGEQIKAYSQIYKEAKSRGYVVQGNVIEVPEDFHYTGAYVVTPEPGLYENVVPFDFTSLYPTTIIAHNIDYSTYVNDERGRDESVPDDMCHIFDWHEHSGCEHDPNVQQVEALKRLISESKATRKTHADKAMVDRRTSELTEAKNNVHIAANPVCQHFRYRFLKQPMGIVPTMLTNLLGERKRVRGMIRKNDERLDDPECPDDERRRLTEQNQVLDKRQLSYKISANSMYGCMGVKKGYLPLPAGACCTTARGRESIMKAQHVLKTTYNATIVYGDTDSCYVQFPNVGSMSELWEHCKRVENEMVANKVFPAPMRLAFEEALYRRFFIMSKKRYMAIECDRQGAVKHDIMKKGVLLARRDNCAFTKHFYKTVMQMIFDGAAFDECLRYIQTVVHDLTSGVYPHADFVITKSIKPLASYKRRSLCASDEKKRTKQLVDADVPMTLHCNSVLQLAHKFDSEELATHRRKVEKQMGRGAAPAALDAAVEESYSTHLSQRYATTLPRALESLVYEFRSLPAVVQLGEKMRYRGCIVEAGSRLEFVIIQTPDSDAMKLWKKVEERSYFVRHSDVLKIDSLYYLKLLVNPIDELMMVAFKQKNVLMQLFREHASPHVYEQIEIEAS